MSFAAKDERVLRLARPGCVLLTSVSSAGTIHASDMMAYRFDMIRLVINFGTMKSFWEFFATAAFRFLSNAHSIDRRRTSLRQRRSDSCRELRSGDVNLKNTMALSA